MIQRSERDQAGEIAFEADLVALAPFIRGFARSLTSDRAYADDLAQETVLRAWRNRQSYQHGTNMKAWTFMILRNQFYSDKRRAWRSTPLDPEIAESTLVSTDRADAHLELNELRQALDGLPPLQREALILVGAGGLAYEEAAVVCGCPVGTVKSRVSRARLALAALLVSGRFPRDEAPASAASTTLLTNVDNLRLASTPGARLSRCLAGPSIVALQSSDDTQTVLSGLRR